MGQTRKCVHADLHTSANILHVCIHNFNCVQNIVTQITQWINLILVSSESYPYLLMQQISFEVLVMTGLADVDGFKISIQVCMWPRFPPLTPRALWKCSCLVKVKMNAVYVNENINRQRFKQIVHFCSFRISLCTKGNYSGGFRPIANKSLVRERLRGIDADTVLRGNLWKWIFLHFSLLHWNQLRKET